MKGNASLFFASRFGCEVRELSFHQKLKRFELLEEKCTSSSNNTLHISLNFSPDDQLDEEKMKFIARDYMQALGFDKQPYLVYYHSDTAHPHLHIVTSTIRPSGSRINLHRLVQRKSEPARKALEITYGLVQAQGRKSFYPEIGKDLQKAVYGEVEVKRSMGHILSFVLSRYHIKDFESFSALVGKYGLNVDQGKPGTRMRNFKGLQYQLCNPSGEPVGVPIKASKLYGAPTSIRLEKYFIRSQIHLKATSAETTKSLQSTLTNKGYLFQKALWKSRLEILQDKEGQFFCHDRKNYSVCKIEELGITREQILASLNYEETGHLLQTDVLQRFFEPTDKYQGVDGQFFKKKKRKKK